MLSLLKIERRAEDDHAVLSPIVYGLPPFRLGTVKVSPCVPVISPLTSFAAT